MKRFIVYRPEPPEHYVREGYANPPDEPQLEGIVFTDGTCVVHWLTNTNSIAIFKTYEDFTKIHGHPEYKTVTKWLDENRKA